MNNKHKVITKIFAVVLTAVCILSCSANANADTTVATPSTPEPAEIQLGDVNHDGRVDSYDALLTLRQSVGFNEIEKDYLNYADFDGDNRITSSDALLILRKSVDLDGSFIKCTEILNVSCGDRLNVLNFHAQIVPEEKNTGVTFTYTPGDSISTDGSGCKVLETTNTGKIKAFHPGKGTVYITSSNGLTASCKVNVSDDTTHQTVTVGNNTLSVTKHMMLNNEAYDETDDFTQLKGIVVHSTATPGAKADVWYRAWNKPGTDAAVHSFLDDEGVYQYLPLEQTAWHAGQPANKYYLDFEICEPSGFYYSGNQLMDYNVNDQQEYFNKIWKNATVYTAYLCKTYGLTESDVISHAEAAKLGIGTNHGDPDHWFILHNKTMDDFRKDVRELLKNNNISITEPRIIKSAPNASGSADFFAENPDVTPFDMFKVWGNESLRY